jgi:PAS domain S-box-containing protein
MSAVRSSPPPDKAALDELLGGLRLCSTEADVVQVLYGGLHDPFGYTVVTLSVLERGDSFHGLTVDRGVLQDYRRTRLSGSMQHQLYLAGHTAVIRPFEGDNRSRLKLMRNRGPGAGQAPELVVWVPIVHGGQVIGAALYQAPKTREVPAEETAFLEAIHRELGVILSNASLRELTRNQAARLGALNEIARALAATHDEQGVVHALQTTLAPLLACDRLELVAAVDRPGPEIAYRRHVAGAENRTTSFDPRSTAAAAARQVLETGSSQLIGDGAEDASRSSVWVPIREADQVRGALAIHSSIANAYEDSTVVFMEQVADQTALALRNAHSYAAIEAQRRRLEVVNAVGRRLTESLDGWSIMRALREELARIMEFDLFGLATIHEGPEGPIAEGYAYDSGHEQAVKSVPLAAAGPSREAYEKKRSVLVRRAPWASALEAERDAHQSVVRGEGAYVTVTRSPQFGRVVTRSFVWVPVFQADKVVALLSLQSYKTDSFDEADVQMLEDVAGHVSLALANADHFAALQTERKRLEVLHAVDLGVAGLTSERQIADAVFAAAGEFLEGAVIQLAYLDTKGQLVGFNSDDRRSKNEEPSPTSELRFFWQVVETGKTVIEAIPDPERRHVVWVPIRQGGRVVAAIAATRVNDQRFSDDDVALLESAAPVVGIALRTVRLHRANEMALAQSVRIQEVASLAGHDLDTVVANVADQALTMLHSTGAACWAFDSGGRISSSSLSGDGRAERVMRWAGMSEGRMPGSLREVRAGQARGVTWLLIPLWYADQLTGALGMVQKGPHLDELTGPMLDFARHAAIAIENARLVAALDRERQMMNAILSHSPVAITLEDGSGRIVYANPEAVSVYGLLADQIVGATFAELMRAAGASVELQTDSEEWRELRLASSGRIVQIRRVAVRGSGNQPAGMLTLHQDYTRQRLAMDAKDLMLRAIGHEVRSPAAAMKMTLAGLLQWGPDIDGEQRRVLLEEAYDMSDRLLDLVEGQLIISKLETGQFEPRPERVSVARAASRVVEILHQRYGERAHEVETRVPARLPGAYCEESHLEQVLTNLIGNCLEYARPPIRVEAREVEGWLELTVSDSGPGMTMRPEDIFQKTAPAGLNRSRGGLGLGLYLCSLVVRRSFGGRIWLAGTGPEGSDFKFTVPAAVTQQGRRHPARQEPEVEQSHGR